MRETSTLSVLLSFGLIALVASIFHEAEAPPEPEIKTAKVESKPSVEKVRNSRISLKGQSRPRLVRSSERTNSPPSEFTTVLKGETLGDVAQRVYGSGELASSLWRSNRDQLDQPDSRLKAGGILRTPKLEPGLP